MSENKRKFVIKDIGGFIFNDTLMAWHDKNDENTVFRDWVQKSDLRFFQCKGRRFEVSEDRLTFEDIGVAISTWTHNSSIQNDSELNI